MNNTPTRLNKYLAHTVGISRREADTHIEEGRVLVNGKSASLGNVIIPGRDVISYNGQEIKPEAKNYTYILMNKPEGYVCSRRQQGDNPTIYALLPSKYQQLKVAGRLDKDSCGLVLLTDDGDTIFNLTHPKFNKQKIYHVRLDRALIPEDKAQIEAGVKLEDGVSQLQVNSLKETGLYKVTMHEGRNRQIRRTFKALDYTVTFLQRRQFANYSLDQLHDSAFIEVSLQLTD